jgi:7-cyano-7-deazaguanine synthase in queuosine biosynthesis
VSQAVLLNSGGIDSRVAAAILHAQGWELHSIYNDWSGVKAQEQAALQTALSYCVEHEVLRWPSPDWVIWDEKLRKRCLPHTTFHTAMIGAIRAVSLGITWIVSGARKESASDSFRDHFQGLLNDSKFYPEKVLVLPVWDLHRAEITFVGRTYGVDFDSTWSCPNGEQHCRECESCKRRAMEGIAL